MFTSTQYIINGQFIKIMIFFYLYIFFKNIYTEVN